MATTSAVDVTAGSGTHVATYSITEDSETKMLQRVVLADNSGADFGTSANPAFIGAAGATLFNGKTTVATAGSRVTLASSQAVRSVTIKALSTNTKLIYVGSSAVAASNGLQLAANESVSLDIANLNTVNLDSDVNGEGVTYIAVGA